MLKYIKLIHDDYMHCWIENWKNLIFVLISLLKAYFYIYYKHFNKP